jgi:thioredoxin reductase
LSGPLVVVGGGPAGLAAGLELRRRGVSEVVVLDREPAAGGIPRHASHQGFGARDLRRLMSGPAYARRYAGLAQGAGIEVRTETMVTGWSAAGALEVTSPRGRETIAAGAVILATGCRERPRSARLVPGSRPDGVMTTGTLQQLVYLHRRRVGRRALVVGGEHVSFSALMTLAHGGARAVAMVTELPRHSSLAVFRAGAALRYRTPLLTRTAVTAIHGRERVEEVELTDLEGGKTRTLACDTVVFTADWIPDNELAVMAGLEMDPGTHGPVVDAALRTSRPGVFAAGNVLHGAETADVAALSGRHAGAAAARFLRGEEPWPLARAPVRCEPPSGAPATPSAASQPSPAGARPSAAGGPPPFKWIAPNAVSRPGDRPPRGHFLLRSTGFVRVPRLEVAQGERVLWSGRLPWLQPGRSARLPSGWTSQVDPTGPPVVCRQSARG